MTDLFGDVVLDVDVKPNRGDALSIVGLAREVSAFTGSPLRFPSTEVEESGRPTAERLRVEVIDTVLCPRFVGRWIDGRHRRPVARPRPVRLLAAGQRPISNVVDASNYVMVELGKPIHTFDAAAVHDGRIIVRRATPGERFVTLDHVERTLDPDTLVIADPAGPIGIAGVMGGETSRGRRGNDGRHRRVGHLRPRQHPPHRLPVRTPLRGQPALREGPGVPDGPPRRRPDRGPRRGMGRRAGRAWRGRFEPGRAAADDDRVPARARQPAGRDCAGTRRTARAPRPGRDRDRGRPPATPRSRSPPATSRCGSIPAMQPSSKRSSRPGAAISRSKRTSPRRSSASTATSWFPRPSRHADAGLSSRAARDSRRGSRDAGRCRPD